MTIVVSGIGLCTPLGMNAKTSWDRLVHPSPRASLGPLPSKRGEGVQGFERACEMSRLAASEALTEAGLWDGRALIGVDPERVGCTVSASKPLFDNSAQLGSELKMHNPCAKRALTPVVHSPDLIGQVISQEFSILGERRNVVAACATGAYSIALGASWIEQGLCDAVLAGSVEPYPHPLIEAGFRQMGVLSGDGVTRPFDARRSGFSLGEGAGVIVLESQEHFRKRLPSPPPSPLFEGRGKKGEGYGSAPYAVLSGWALGADSHSAVAFNSGGARISAVMDRALGRAGLPKEAIRHVNAHGTGTRLNDKIETQALQKSFGQHAKHLMISGTKASTGHLLGASGSVEFILALLALRRQFVPPTATLQKADPECPLDYTPGEGHAAAFDHALSLSFGFGGPIGVLVVSR